MFVRCTNCQTQFSLDDRQIGADGVAVRCAVCRYVFRVDPPDGTGTQAWRVQTVDGDLFQADDLPTMRVWIREGRLHPDDTISRTGKHWIRLGDMPEFSDAFAGFPDLPEVLGAPEEAPVDAEDLSAVGPPPSYAGDPGDERPTAVADVVRPVEQQASERLDMSGLFAAADYDEPDEREEPDDPDDTVVHGRVADASGPRSSSNAPIGAVSRTSMFEDSASMVLDDLVEQTVVTTDISKMPSAEPPGESAEPPPSGTSPRKPKHRTTKVRTVAAVEEADPEASGVVRVLDDVDVDVDVDDVDVDVDDVDVDDVDDVEELESDDLAGVDVAQLEEVREEDAPKSPSGGKRRTNTGSMLGAVTAHVKVEPVKPLTGPLRVAAASEVSGASEASSPTAAAHLSEVDPSDLFPRGRRASWPLFAGLGLLCGAAVIFGIPPIRERVMGMAGFVAGAQEGKSAPASLSSVDAALRSGTQAELSAAAALAAKEAETEGLAPGHRADVGLAAVEARAAVAIALRLEAAHGSEQSDARFRADDAAEAAGQAFAGIDVGSATPARLARTRARLRLAQGRPEDEVLPLVPADDPELRAMVLGAQLWSAPQARVPSGLISTLTSVEDPSVGAQVLLAMAYARGGDEVGAAKVREALEKRAPDDPTVRALLSGHAEAPGVAAGGGGVPGVDPSAGEVSAGGDTAPDPDGPDGPDDPDDPEETIVVSDTPAQGMSVDKLISKGCSKVEGGDVSGGLKLLLRAFDRRPNDIDVLVCLGTANRKKGTNATALRYYQKALARSPRFMPALLGAARAATKLGEGDKALGFYRRVLAISPSHAEAKSFVAKKTAPDKKPTPPSGDPKPEPDRKPEPPTGTDTAPRKPEPPSGDAKPEPPAQ